MAKPSIFSGNYDKEIKKRKRRIRITVIILIALLAGAGFVVYKNDDIGSILNNIKETVFGNGKDKEKQEEKPKEEPKDQPKDEDDDKTLDIAQKLEIKLLDNSTIDMIVDKQGKILNAELDEENYKLIISESASRAIIYDKLNQTMQLIDNKGKSTDISYEKYISTNGQVTLRDAVLASNPKFNWTKEPLFLSENTVVFVSSVPWFRDELYVWVYNIETQKHTSVRQGNGGLVGGNKIVIKEITEDKKLKLVIDGVVYLIDETGLAVRE